MSAPDSIQQLVDRFDEQRAAYRVGKYNETQVRLDFLNPLFEALGWDVSNRKGYAERYREVILEPSVEMEGQAKAADYAFRVGDKTLFFVEAKKPAVNIGANPEPAFQVRRYGWSAKLSISILSDFEQLAVYDCRITPKHGDPATLGRVKLYSFQDYAEKWDEISAIFSRQAVLKGSFDQFAEGLKGKRGTADVDDAFLEEMERWRGDLARNIALRNPALSSRELNSAVQTTIDRIIFLRICEERGIEAEDALRNATDGKDVYQDLVQLFKQADKKYNSGLFHFSDEKGQASYPDRLTLGLKIDDKVLKDILAHLYYPLSPYAFKYIPVAILGQVYERFLGKVIRLTAGHQAKVEEKPEVRKAGGVYYTPTYIVEYIVKHTLGELLRGASPLGDKDQTAESQKNQPLRVLDPACGSGSFLLGAYQYLLDWYLDWYIHNDPARWSKGKAPAVVESQGGWQLTMDKKKEILLSHIYGVDIDAQAVEVTKLSLLLKVVENPGQLSWLNERILPDLGENIKCGNSLIGPDYYDDRQMPIFGDEESYRVNVFDWHKAFPQVFAAGGFDAVIGNPPYVRQEMLGAHKKYFQQHYQIYNGAADLYTYFIERGVSLLRESGLFSYIVANKWMRANYGQPLRSWLKTQQIEEIVDFGDLPVFERATTYTCILRIKGGRKPGSQFTMTQVKALNFSNLDTYVLEHSIPIRQEKLEDRGWTLANEQTSGLIEKLRQRGMPLGQYVDGKIYRGILTGLNEAFVVDAATRERLIEEDERSAELIKPFLAGRDVKRYALLRSDRFLIFTRHGINIKQYPAIERYLSQFKTGLMPKPKNWSGIEWIGRKPGAYQWYEIQDTIDYYSEFEKPKIIIPSIVQSASYTYDRTGFYSNDKTSIIPTDDLYLLGVLNSKPSDFVMHQIASTKQGGYFEYKPMYVAQLPIRLINFSDPADTARHARMVALVEGMLALHEQAAAARLAQEKEMIQRQIQATDAQIDRLVYALYELTEEEIKIVEGE